MALIVSVIIHLGMIFRVNSMIPWSFDVKEDFDKIEFDFFQANPQKEKKVFIPLDSQKFVETMNEMISMEDQMISSSVYEELEQNEIHETNDVLEPLNLEADLREQLLIDTKKHEEMSEVLKTEIELDQTKTDFELKLDYSQHVLRIVEQHIEYPEDFIGEMDIVKIEITLNRDGQLIEGTPRISKLNSSRYELLNQTAIESVKKAENLFPPLPKRLKKDRITFLIPIKFKK